MPTGLYTRWEYDSEKKTITARQKKSRSFANMFLSHFQRSRPNCKIEINFTAGRQNKIDCFSVDGICYHCNTVFEAFGCYYRYCPCQEARSSLTETDIERGVKKLQQDEMCRDYIQQNGYQIVEMWECEWWADSIKVMNQSKVTSEKKFPTDLLWVKNNSCKELSIGDSFVMLNVILKCLNTGATTFPISFPYSKILLWVGMILVIWLNSKQKRITIWLSLEECSYQAFF